ncbi:MAG: adenylate/guanylate cyclase domain-containing protein [Actinomycetota bacterium]
MTLRKAILAALRGDTELLPGIAEVLRQRIDEKEEGPMTTVVQAAGALEPIIAEAVRRKPSRLGVLGLKSAHLLASLAERDDDATGRLVAIARNQTVGIVFADIDEFTRYTAENGDDAAIAALQRLQPVVERAAANGKGEVVKALGDGYLLAFPSASQAVRGAVSLRDGALKLRREDPRFPLFLQVAVHAGEPLVEGDDLLGHDVNLTARVLDHCAPAEVLVTEAAKELAEQRLQKITFSKKRDLKIRGLAGKVTVYSVNPVDERARRPLRIKRTRIAPQRSSSS